MAERTIVDVANYLKSHGLTPAEHPLFGGVGGGHVAGSYHHSKDKEGGGGAAVDIRDWRPDMAPEFPGGPQLHWKERTARLAQRAKQLGIFAEALGPGDKGHDTHTHLALPGRRFITDQQLSWLATGQTPLAGGGFSPEMPTLNQQSPQGTPAQQPALSDSPAAINIVVQTGGKDEEEKTPEQHLKDYIADMRKQTESVIPVNSLVKMMASQPVTNYFA